MRLRHIPGAAETISAHEMVFTYDEAIKNNGSWSKVYPAVQPLHLEIGMGRGKFVFASANVYPKINFLGLEIREAVIYTALEREVIIPKNCRFLWMDAANLNEVFDQGEIDQIYLNFSDPWPKARHAKRRLTAPTYLEQYQKILKPSGSIRFKTDNEQLFDWSNISFEENGWQAIEISRDLPIEESGIISEYETRFRRMGQPIFFSEWRKI